MTAVAVALTSVVGSPLALVAEVATASTAVDPVPAGVPPPPPSPGSSNTTVPPQAMNDGTATRATARTREERMVRGS